MRNSGYLKPFTNSSLCLVNRVYKDELVKGFKYPEFRINRESKVESYNKQYRNKMPDIHIDITRASVPEVPSHDGLFVECKPVDRDHPAGRDYCDRGVLRFVDGDYAWALPQGMMVGYAATGYTIAAKLGDAMTSRTAE